MASKDNNLFSLDPKLSYKTLVVNLNLNTQRIMPSKEIPGFTAISIKNKEEEDQLLDEYIKQQEKKTKGAKSNSLPKEPHRCNECKAILARETCRKNEHNCKGQKGTFQCKT